MPGALIGLRFHGLHAAPPSDEIVSPALPRILRELGERSLPASFFVDEDVARNEEFALAMLENGRFEIGAAVDDDGSLGALNALVESEQRPAGISVAESAGLDWVELKSYESLEFACVPDDMPIDGALLTVVRFEPGSVASLARSPANWHSGLQVAIGRAMQRQEQTILSFEPAALERGDAAAFFAELLDLLAGLQRAERVEVKTLGELARIRP